VADLGDFAADPDTEPAPRPGTISLECQALVLRYVNLRIRDAGAEARLGASMAEAGQTSPVIVVHDADGRPVLLDGYRRVRALGQLGNDTVLAILLGLSEADGLVYCHRQETSRRRSVVEEGWLVRELCVQGPTLQAIGVALGRTASWVSRRMALVSALPESAEEAVRSGRVPPHAAMKSLVPLARANKAHCEQLVRALGDQRVTTRQVAQLYAAWRAGDDEVRERIASAPRLFLRAVEASVPEPGDEIGWLIQKLGVADEALRRTGESLARATSADARVVTSPRVRRAIRTMRAAWEALHSRMEEYDAGPRYADRDLAVAGERARHPPDLARPPGVARARQEGAQGGDGGGAVDRTAGERGAA
jgi:ParB family chromosome partitioning protein